MLPSERAVPECAGIENAVPVKSDAVKIAVFPCAADPYKGTVITLYISNVFVMFPINNSERNIRISNLCIFIHNASLDHNLKAAVETSRDKCI